MLRLKLLTEAPPAEIPRVMLHLGASGRAPMVWLVDGLKHVRKSDLLCFNVKEGTRMLMESEVQTGFLSLTTCSATGMVRKTSPTAEEYLRGPLASWRGSAMALGGEPGLTVGTRL